jgi:hypothetical protein
VDVIRILAVLIRNPYEVDSSTLNFHLQKQSVCQTTLIGHGSLEIVSKIRKISGDDCVGGSESLLKGVTASLWVVCVSHNVNVVKDLNLSGKCGSSAFQAEKWNGRNAGCESGIQNNIVGTNGIPHVPAYSLCISPHLPLPSLYWAPSQEVTSLMMQPCNPYTTISMMQHK